MDDAFLVQRILQGDNQAYLELVHRWAAPVLAVCQAYIGRADTAGLLAERTLEQGLESLPSLQNPERFGPWLVGLAESLCKRWLEETQQADLTDGTQDQPLTNDLDLLWIAEAISSLPIELRVVLLLRYQANLPPEVIAQTLDLQPEAVKERLRSARWILQRKGIGPPRGSSPHARFGSLGYAHCD